MKRLIWLFAILLFSNNGYANNGWERLPTQSEIDTSLQNLENRLTTGLRDAWGDALQEDPLIFSQIIKYHYRDYRHGYDNSLIPVVPHVEASGLVVVVRYREIPHYAEAWNLRFDLHYYDDQWSFEQGYADKYTTLEKAHNTIVTNLKANNNDLGFASPVSPIDSSISLTIAPSLSPNTDKIGLIPAIDGARALISYKGNPNKVVLTKATSNISGSRISLAEHPMRRLDVAYAKNAIGDTLEFKTDSNGKLDIVVFLRLTQSERGGYAPLSSPGEIGIVFREEGRKATEVSTSIKVGLGLHVYGDKMINVSPQHVWYAFVESTFHRDFDLLAYQERVNDSPVAPEVLVNVRSVPINYEADGSHMTDGASGKADFVPVGADKRRSVGQYHSFSKAPKGVVLTPAFINSRQPYYDHKGIKLPAILQKKNGFYAKGFYALTAIAEHGGIGERTISSNQDSLEPRALDGKVYILTLDEPQSVYASLACMFNAQTANQLAVLTLLEILPPIVAPGPGAAIGKGVGMVKDMTGVLCDLMNGNYDKFVSNIEGVAGKQAAEYLITERLIPTLLDGKLSPELYRLVGRTVSDAEKKSIAYALQTAYGTGGSLVGEAGYNLPSQEEELRERIRKAIEEKNQAFEDYTRLATEGGEGDIDKALKRYREAYQRLKELE